MGEALLYILLGIGCIVLGLFILSLFSKVDLMNDEIGRATKGIEDTQVLLKVVDRQLDSARKPLDWLDEFSRTVLYYMMRRRKSLSDEMLDELSHLLDRF